MKQEKNFSSIDLTDVKINNINKINNKWYKGTPNRIVLR